MRSHHSFLVSVFFEPDVVIIEGENVLISVNPECLHVFQSLHLLIWRPALSQIKRHQLTEEDVTEIIKLQI